jgi:hypothetical protein
MFVGHYSAAFIAKRLEPRWPLWSLLVAAQLVDFAWVALVLLGIEEVALSPEQVSYMPFTHSLSATVLWALLSGGVAMAIFRRQPKGWQAAAVLAAAVASHWLCDFMVHGPDLGLWGNDHKVGLGLSNQQFPIIATAAELFLVAAAAWWLSQRGHRRRLLVLVVALMVAHVSAQLGGTPTSVVQLVLAALASFVVVAVLGWWVERGHHGKQAL